MAKRKLSRARKKARGKAQRLQAVKTEVKNLTKQATARKRITHELANSYVGTKLGKKATTIFTKLASKITAATYGRVKNIIKGLKKDQGYETKDFTQFDFKGKRTVFSKDKYYTLTDNQFQALFDRFVEDQKSWFADISSEYDEDEIRAKGGELEAEYFKVKEEIDNGFQDLDRFQGFLNNRNSLIAELGEHLTESASDFRSAFESHHKRFLKEKIYEFNASGLVDEDYETYHKEALGAAREVLGTDFSYKDAKLGGTRLTQVAKSLLSGSKIIR